LVFAVLDPARRSSAPGTRPWRSRLLLDVDPAELRGPMAGLTPAPADETGCWRLVRMMNADARRSGVGDVAPGRNGRLFRPGLRAGSDAVRRGAAADTAIQTGSSSAVVA
jgi:hypothetical protein